MLFETLKLFFLYYVQNWMQHLIREPTYGCLFLLDFPELCVFSTWHCISAFCSSSLQSSSEVLSRSQREFISFNPSLNSHASSESGWDWRKSALLRLMDMTSDLWASITFWSSWIHKVKNTHHIHMRGKRLFIMALNHKPDKTLSGVTR